MEQLGKLESEINLRSVWPHEALNFTPWLAQKENLEQLGKAVGINIVLEERESAVGDFNVDIFAKEEGTDRRIIIENQLEKSDHDHLGKIITYASGKDAEIVIWIVSKAREEHQQAIEWLNLHTDEKCAFFLIEIELWRIGNSPLAPKFNIVEKPNDWAKAMRSGNFTAGDNLRLEFWTAFKEYAEKDKELSNSFKLRKPRQENWYDLSVGSPSFYISLVVSLQNHKVKAGIYFPDNKDIYNKFCERKQDVEKLMGTADIEWNKNESAKSSSLYVSKDIDINERENWPAAFGWLRDQCVRLKALSKEIIP